MLLWQATNHNSSCSYHTMLHHTPKAYGSLGHDASSHQKKATVTKSNGAHLFKWLAALCVLEGVGAATVPWSAEPVASGSNSSVSLMSPKENVRRAAAVHLHPNPNPNLKPIALTLTLT